MNNRVFAKCLMFLASFFWISVAAAQSGAGTVSFKNTVASPTLGRLVSYALYLPPGFEKDSRSYPVIYLLHGGGSGQPSDWFTLARIDQVLDRLIAAGEIPPVIAIAPDGRRDLHNEVATYFMDDADGLTRWEEMFRTEFLPTVEMRHSALGTGQNRAILGLSMGGVAAVTFQLRQPDDWAGIAALSAAFRTQEQITGLSQPAYDARYGGWFGVGLKGSARLNEQWAQTEINTLIAKANKNEFSRIPRIYFDIGADDPFFAGNAETHLTMQETGLRHRFRVREGGHDWNYWRAGLDDAVLHLSAVLTRGYGE